MSAVTVVIGAGSIGQAIARRVSAGRHVLSADLRQGNTTFATWKLMHAPGAMLKRAAGIPALGNQRSEWDLGCRFDFENPEHR